jgi:spore germination cell wall hydrolase CwlJ-like protein
MNIFEKMRRSRFTKITIGAALAIIVGIICLNGEQIHPKASSVKPNNKAIVASETAATTVVTHPVMNSSKKLSETTKKTSETKSTTTTTVKTTEQVTTENTTAAKTTTVAETTVSTTTTEQKPVQTVSDCFTSMGYTPTANEMNMFCTVVSSETGYCEDAAQKAVAHTIINRVLSDKFPNNIYDVVTQENQYTAIHSYFDGQYRPGLEPGSDGWNHTMQLCYEAMAEYDFTNGAVAYYNPEMIGYNSWFESLTLVYADQYGRFFKI